MSNRQEAIIADVVNRARRIHQEINAGNGNLGLETEDVGFESQDTDSEDNNVNVLNIGHQGAMHSHSSVLIGDVESQGLVTGNGVSHVSGAATEAYGDRGGNYRMATHATAGLLHEEVLNLVKRNTDAMNNLHHAISTLINQSRQQHEEVLSAISRHMSNAQFASLAETHRQQQAATIDGMINSSSSDFGRAPLDDGLLGYANIDYIGGHAMRYDTQPDVHASTDSSVDLSSRNGNKRKLNQLG